MKNKKSKSIAFVLVFVLLIATVIVTSVANAKTTDVQITADRENISAGESATVSVKVTTNYPVATMSIPVFYDKTLVDVSEAVATLSEYSVANTTTDSQSVDTAKVYANTDIDENKFGFVLVTYIGGANEEVAESIDEVVLTFKITAKADASGSAAIKVVKESAKTSENAKGMLYFGAVPKGTTITDIPENVENKELENATANVKIGEETPTLNWQDTGYEYAEFVVNDTNNTNYGEFTGIIYGIDALDWNPEISAYTDLASSLKASTDNENHIVIEANEEWGVESTGAIIKIVDDDGKVLETYVYVYFGDVDGDGEITGNDVYMTEEYPISYDTMNSYAQFVAADVDGDGEVGGNDVYCIEEYPISYDTIDYQYNIGQMAVNNTYEWIY